MTYLNGWTGISEKNGKPVEYSKLVNWEALIAVDSLTDKTAKWPLSTNDKLRKDYAEKEITQGKKEWKKNVGCHIATIEKMCRLDNGLIQFVFLDSAGDIITREYGTEDKFEEYAALLNGYPAETNPEWLSRAGKTISPAKSAAAKENGKKGGRTRTAPLK